MNTFFSVILTSTVISAIISSLVSVSINKIELEVKLKLEEKNKWIENINKTQDQFINSTSKYTNDLILYTTKQADSLIIFESLSNTKEKHNSLIFYMYQSEYSLKAVEDVEKIMVKISDVLNNQQAKTLEHRSTHIDNKKYLEYLKSYRIELAGYHTDLSKKLGEMIRTEKKEMTDIVINRTIFKRLSKKK